MFKILKCYFKLVFNKERYYQEIALKKQLEYFDYISNENRKLHNNLHKNT